MPKFMKKILSLGSDEVSAHVESSVGSRFTKSQKNFHEKNNRDTAILTLRLGTGIRGSECVGLD
jgi:site-specific recombinase XerD